jgi:iron complex outermembrane recepter protein
MDTPHPIERAHASWPSLAFLLPTLALVLSAPLARGQATAAQPAATEPPDDTVVLSAFIVTGVRGSLMQAQEIKRTSIQLVDSVVAEDIGKLPDNTVADALQHLPGIQVGRGNGEVGTVLIRGLPNLGTTLNGNEIFTGTSRGVALQDIPAELVAGVDVYKSTSPELVEGGIAGLVNIRTRRPLDFDRPQFATTLRGIYGENADKTGYVGSVLLSDRWQTGAGEIGALYSGAYQQRYFVDQVAFNFLFEPVDVPPTLVPGQTQLQLPFTQGSLIIPGDRQRHAHNLSLQWRVNEELQVYNDFLNTAYRNKHQVHFLIGFPRFGAFTAANVASGDVPTSTTSVNNFHLTSTQAFQQQTDGYQNVLGARWQRGDTTLRGEYLYNWNSFKNQVLIVDTRFGPPTPGTFTFTYNDNGRANLRIADADVTHANNYYLWGLFDNRDYSTSEQNGFRLDLTQRLNHTFFQEFAGGLRWTEREARFRGTSRNDVAPAGATNGDRFAPTVPNTGTIPGFGSVNPPGPLDYYSTPHWFGASPSYLYNRPNDVRALFGLPAGPADFNPTLGFTDDESVLAGYASTTFATMLADKALNGSLGFRVARTTQDLEGYRTDGTPINDKKSQTDVLPILNTRLKLTDALQLRFSAGRTITRPNFSDLNPAVTLNAPTTTGGAAGTGSGGNPDLNTVKSNNYDLSLEYYFTEASYIAATGFLREIDGYVQTFAATETINGVNYTVVRPRNSGRGELRGLELSYQHFPANWGGFGWMTNYTYISGDTDTPDLRPGAAVGARRRQPYAQVSRHSYNIILVYEARRFSTRLAYNWRGSFTETFDGPNAAGSPLRQIIAKPTDTLDLSVSYAVTDRLTITADATNILDSHYQDYFHDASRYPRDTRAYDRTFALGLRYRY